MAPGRHRKLFEELGIVDKPPLPNPYRMLGLDPSLAQDLLRESRDGAATLKLAAEALYKALSKRYHPDVDKTGNADRFREITEANERIDKAKPDALARWAKVDQTGGASSHSERKLTAERAEFTNHMAEMFQTSLELGSDPNHFSQMAWSQGVLLQRANIPLLLRTSPEGESQVTRGEVLGESGEAFGLSSFLLKNRSFGLEPGTDIRAYVDKDGRATLLTSDLEFLMDITDPVEKYRRQQESLRLVQSLADDSDLWVRSKDPVLLMTQVPTKTVGRTPATQALIFRGGNNDNPLTWTLSMRVAGTIGNTGFFRRMRHNQTLPALAGSGKQTMNYFSLAATPATQIIQHDAMYSPLLKDGSLLLFDQASESPIVTDAKVIGMIGSHSGAA